KTHATALWPTDALQTIATNWPTAVAARMMGRDAPTAVAGTMPASTRPSATDPTMKLGSPITAGSPASGPAMVASVGAASSTRAGAGQKHQHVHRARSSLPLIVGAVGAARSGVARGGYRRQCPAGWESSCRGRRGNLGDPSAGGA